MATVSNVLTWARSQIGYCRYDDPEQGTRYGRWYADITGSPWFGTNGVPYCAMFVSWVLAHAGVECEGFPRAVAIDVRDGFSRMVAARDLRPGDVVGFDWDEDHTGDHVGIFLEWDTPGYSFETIEGNTGDGEVLQRTRYVSQVTCGVRPYYDGSSNPAEEVGLLDIDGACGPKTVMVWQTQMGTAQDGVISGQTHDEDCYRPNVWSVEYGEGGSSLVYAIQQHLRGRDHYYSGSMDGCWGKQTSLAIQKYLKDTGHYVEAIDGIAGPHTVKAIQKSLNDGKWR